jgi:hypothetical protein
LPPEPARARYPRRGATITRSGTGLRHEIPIRTFTEWTAARPGFLEVDLVAYCGASTEGFYLCTPPRRRWRRLTGAFHGVAGVDVPGVPPPGIWLGYVYPIAPRTVAGAGCGEPDAQ